MAATGTPTIRVLVVDDNIDDADTLRMILEMRREVKYIVDTANTAEEAKRKVKESHFNVLLLDLNLPDGRGPNLVRELLSIDPSVGVVALTGWGDVNNNLERAVRQAGADEYLTKPASPVDISTRLQWAVIHRHLQAEKHDLEKAFEDLGSVYAPKDPSKSGPQPTASKGQP
jgi:two-component system response regulator TctD